MTRPTYKLCFYKNTERIHALFVVEGDCDLSPELQQIDPSDLARLESGPQPPERPSLTEATASSAAGPLPEQAGKTFGSETSDTHYLPQAGKTKPVVRRFRRVNEKGVCCEFIDGKSSRWLGGACTIEAAEQYVREGRYVALPADPPPSVPQPADYVPSEEEQKVINAMAQNVVPPGFGAAAYRYAEKWVSAAFVPLLAAKQREINAALGGCELRAQCDSLVGYWRGQYATMATKATKLRAALEPFAGAVLVSTANGKCDAPHLELKHFRVAAAALAETEKPQGEQKPCDCEQCMAHNPFSSRAEALRAGWSVTVEDEPHGGGWLCPSCLGKLQAEPSSSEQLISQDEAVEIAADTKQIVKEAAVEAEKVTGVPLEEYARKHYQAVPSEQPGKPLGQRLYELLYPGCEWSAEKGCHARLENAAAAFAASLDQERQRQINALQKFKRYVHDRLDAAGIPTHPDGPHSKEGCRIGDRLDIALSKPRLTAADAAEWLNKHGDRVAASIERGPYFQRCIWRDDALLLVFGAEPDYAEGTQTMTGQRPRRG